MNYNQRMVLAERPDGEPDASHFRLIEEGLRPLAPGRARMRTIYTSVDPAMRIRMNEADSYMPRFEIGDTVGTYSVGEIVESTSESLPVGAYVMSFSGWETMATVGPRSAFVLHPPEGVPLSAYLGVLGFTGFTAWLGLEDIGKPKSGETLLVTAASGAVGSIVGQLGQIRGMRTVGITSGAQRCAMLTERFGFDLAIDRNANDVAGAIDAACPDGIDVFFDNTGGPLQHMAFDRMALNGRIVMCGMIAQYNDEMPEPGPNLMAVVTKRLRIGGFIASDSIDRMPAYQADAAHWVAQSRLRADETIMHGLSSGPDAFRRLLAGDKIGKMVLQLAPDPFAPERAAPESMTETTVI